MKKVSIPHTDIRVKLKLIINNIRKIRESRNFSQAYMAAQLHISQNTYSKLELGYTALSLERLILIAQVLNVSIMTLINTDQSGR